MSKPHARAVRRTTLALACTAAIASLAACGPDNGSDASSGDASPSAGSATPSASASTGNKAKPNGIEKRTAKEIYVSATRANADAGSFREQVTSSVTKSDLKVSATECVGTVDKLQHGSFEIIRKGSDVWVKADAQFAAWAKTNASAIPSGKWLHGTSANPMMKAFGSYCHAEQFTNPDKTPSDLTTGKGTTVNGVPVVPVGRTVGNKSMTYYVATTGAPNLIKRDVEGRDELPDITYSDFGKPVGASAPTGEVTEAPSR